MVNIFHLYTAVTVLCLTGAVPVDMILKLLTAGVISILSLLGVGG